MSFNETLLALDPFHTHENGAIAEFAQNVNNYALALKRGEISQEEYVSLIQDINTLKSMARTADEESQVVMIHQAAMQVLSMV
jgi:hypothetical protein